MVVGPHQLEVSDMNGWKVSRKELNCGIGSESVFGICWWLCVGAGAINREVFDRVMTSLAWLLQWLWLSFHNGFCCLASLAEYYNLSGQSSPSVCAVTTVYLFIQSLHSVFCPGCFSQERLSNSWDARDQISSPGLCWLFSVSIVA